MTGAISAAEIAVALGIVERAVRKRAARERWPYTEIPVRGGRKRLYDPAALPDPIRAQILLRQAQAATPKVAVATPDVAPYSTPTGQPIPAAMPSPAAEPSPAATVAGGLAGGGGERDLYIGALMSEPDPAVRRRKEEALKRLRAIEPVLAGRIRGRAAIEQHAASLATTAASIYRWVKEYQRGGVAALEDKPRSDMGKARVCVSSAWEIAARAAGIAADARARIACDIVPVIRGLWAQQGQRSWRQVALLASPKLMEMSMAAGMDEKTAKRVCKLPRKLVEAERRYAVIALADRDAKGFYDRVCTSVNRSRAQLLLGDVVFGDVSPADIPVLRPDGQMGWAQLIVWRDAATNMMHVTGYLADKGSGVRREHVALAFAAMCEQAPWGLPRRLYLDNGSEFNWAGMLEAWSALTRFSAGAFAGVWGTDALDDVGRIWRSEPFRPRAKLIEGGFSNLLQFMGWHPCFAGSDRLTKKTRSLGKPIDPTTLDDLRGFIGQAVEFYHGVTQSGHLDGLSPAEKMAEFQNKGFKRATVDAETLAMAFADVDERKVSAGTVSVGGWRYQHARLYEFEGEKVVVRWAKHAPDAAYIFHPKTRIFLCAAYPMPIFEWADAQGAKHAKKLASEAKRAVEVMRGQVAWLDPRELMAEFAKYSGVRQVIDEADRDPIRIGLDKSNPEVAALTRAREEAAAAAVERAARARAQTSELLPIYKIDEDPEVLAARAMGL